MLPDNSFYTSRVNKSGLMYECKECWRQRNYRKYPQAQTKRLANASRYQTYENEPEIWKEVPNFDGIYSVSDLGRVRRNDVAFDGVMRARGGLMAPRIERGYLAVSLQTPIHGKKKWTIHRLVATVFIGECPFIKAQVNHKDGNRQNNRAVNLEWCSQQENLYHQHYVLNSRTYGEKGNNACFKDADIPALREKLQTQSANSLAKEMGVSPKTLLRIRNRETYAHIP